MRHLFFFLKLTLIGWNVTGVFAFKTLLGRTDASNLDISKMMEIYHIYNRGYNYCYQHDSWLSVYVPYQDLKISAGWISNILGRRFSPISDSELVKTLHNEVNYNNLIDTSGRELTDLFALLTVQFISLVTSFQFAYGHQQFKQVGNEKASSECAELSYCFAYYGLAFDDTFVAIEKILEKKYSRGKENFNLFVQAMKNVMSFVELKFVKQHDAVAKSIRAIESVHWDGLEVKHNIRENVNIAYKYLRSMVFGEKMGDTTHILDNYVDLKADTSLWTLASSYRPIMHDTSFKLHYNKDSNKIDMYNSNVINILREIDLFKVGRRKDDSVKNGLENGYLTLRPSTTPNESYSRLEFRQGYPIF